MSVKSEVGSTLADESNRNENKPKIVPGSSQLWQFILGLLSGKDENSNCVIWEGEYGEFRVIDPEQLAHLWGKKKKRPNMNYDKLTRALRYYYDKGILSKIPGKRFSYKFDFSNLISEGYTLPKYLYKSPSWISACVANLGEGHNSQYRLGGALYYGIVGHQTLPSTAITLPNRATSPVVHSQPGFSLISSQSCLPAGNHGLLTTSLHHQSTLCWCSQCKLNTFWTDYYKLNSFSNNYFYPYGQMR